MTNPIPWFLLVAKAIDDALDTARLLGLDLPGQDELEQLLAKVNAQVAKGLGPSVIALDLAVQLAKASADAKIGALGEDPRCPRCGEVLRRWISLTPATGERTERSACDAVGCGWRSA